MDELFMRLWPVAASQYAGEVDRLVFSFTGMMMFFILPVFILAALFTFRYRRGSRVSRDHRPRGNRWLEMTWILLPFIGSMAIYLSAAKLYYQARTPPDDALEIQVVAKQWMWKFQHPGGQREIDTLHVPAGRPVKLNMISEDVIHSLFFPALRVKQDVLPGRYTQLWFNADKTGRFEGYCAEYCGTDHSHMLATLVIQPPEDYARWLEQAGTSDSLAEQGAALFRQYGCSGCHDRASQIHAPPLEGLYGRRVALADGGSVEADDGYLRDSILLPQKQVVAGFEPIMPSFANLLDEDQVLRLVAYLKSLGAQKEEDQNAPAGPANQAPSARPQPFPEEMPR